MSDCKQKQAGGDLCPDIARLAVKVVKLEARITELTDALDNLLDECTNQGGHAEDYINALKKAEAILEVIK